MIKYDDCGWECLITPSTSKDNIATIFLLCGFVLGSKRTALCFHTTVWAQYLRVGENSGETPEKRSHSHDRLLAKLLKILALVQFCFCFGVRSNAL